MAQLFTPATNNRVRILIGALSVAPWIVLRNCLPLPFRCEHQSRRPTQSASSLQPPSPRMGAWPRLPLLSSGRRKVRLFKYSAYRDVHVLPLAGMDQFADA